MDVEDRGRFVFEKNARECGGGAQEGCEGEEGMHIEDTQAVDTQKEIA